MTHPFFAEFGEGGHRHRGRGRRGCGPLRHLAEFAQRGFHGGFGGPFGGFGGPGGAGGFGPWMREGFGGDLRGDLLRQLVDGPLTGYQLMQALGTSGWTPEPGKVYPMLQQLEDEGLIQAEAADGQKRYSLTEAGTAAAAAAPAEAWPGQALRQQLQQLKLATMAVFQADAATQAQARELLAETSRALHHLLAQTPETPAQASN